MDNDVVIIEEISPFEKRLEMLANSESFLDWFVYMQLLMKDGQWERCLWAIFCCFPILFNKEEWDETNRGNNKKDICYTLAVGYMNLFFKLLKTHERKGLLKALNKWRHAKPEYHYGRLFYEQVTFEYLDQVLFLLYPSTDSI